MEAITVYYVTYRNNLQYYSVDEWKLDEYHKRLGGVYSKGSANLETLVEAYLNDSN